jgi:hypothetical protein
VIFRKSKDTPERRRRQALLAAVGNAKKSFQRDRDEFE